jgi:hypothetical protein
VRLLVLAPERVDAKAIRGALGDVEAGTEVRVVTPAQHESAFSFLMDDHDDKIAEAGEAGRETVEALREEGLRASGGVGDADPLQALQDELATFRADRILVFYRAEDDRRFKEGDVIGEAESRFGLPVVEAELPGR